MTIDGNSRFSHDEVQGFTALGFKVPRAAGMN